MSAFNIADVLPMSELEKQLYEELRAKMRELEVKNFENAKLKKKNKKLEKDLKDMENDTRKDIIQLLDECDCLDKMVVSLQNDNELYIEAYEESQFLLNLKKEEEEQRRQQEGGGGDDDLLILPHARMESADSRVLLQGIKSSLEDLNIAPDQNQGGLDYDSTRFDIKPDLLEKLDTLDEEHHNKAEPREEEEDREKREEEKVKKDLKQATNEEYLKVTAAAVRLKFPDVNTLTDQQLIIRVQDCEFWQYHDRMVTLMRLEQLRNEKNKDGKGISSPSRFTRSVTDPIVFKKNISTPKLPDPNVQAFLEVSEEVKDSEQEK